MPIKLIMFAACIVGMLQPVLVPFAASKRGRDGAAWFVITIIWLFFSTILAALASVAGYVAIYASDVGTASAYLTGIAALGVFVLVTCLPLIAVLAGGNRKAPDSYARGRGRRGRTTASASRRRSRARALRR